MGQYATSRVGFFNTENSLLIHSFFSPSVLPFWCQIPCCVVFIHLIATVVVHDRWVAMVFRGGGRGGETVPAAVVLRKIATIINGDAHPLPYPYRNIKQKAVVYQDDYKLEVCILPSTLTAEVCA